MAFYSDECKSVYILRTCNESLVGYKKMKWPESGYIETSEWYPEPFCGENCLVGLLWGEGNGGLLDWSTESKWLVIRSEGPILDLGDYVKFKSGYVEYCGDRKAATDFIISKGANPTKVVGAFITAGDQGTATAGRSGFATSGRGGTSTAGDYGKALAGDYGKAAAGDYGIAVVDGMGAVTAGYRGASLAGDYGTALVGNHGTAIAGECGKAAAGECGIISIKYWDSSTDRWRVKTGHIGEDGILPDTLYRLNDNNEFTEVKK